MQVLKKILEHWKIITGVGAIIIAILTTSYSLMIKYENIMEKLDTTQQMSLKAIIWNKEIPYSERASVCDTYLEAGYNSLTKKLCERILSDNMEV